MDVDNCWLTVHEETLSDIVDMAVDLLEKLERSRELTMQTGRKVLTYKSFHQDLCELYNELVSMYNGAGTVTEGEADELSRMHDALDERDVD